MSCKIVFFTGILLVFSVSAMNVSQNYALAAREYDARKYPFLLSDKKHTRCLHESLYDQFIKERVFILSMVKEDRLPMEIGNLIMTKSRLMEYQSRDRQAEKVLWQQYDITYEELCYLTKAQKQLLLYCVKDAKHIDGILIIEGRDKQFSKEMRKRFYSLPVTIQEKLSRHPNGNSLYVKMDYESPSLFNRLIGQDCVVQEENIKNLAKIAAIIPAIMTITAIGIAFQQEIPQQTSALFVNVLKAETIIIKEIVEKGIAIGVPKLVMVGAGGVSAMFGVLGTTMVLGYMPFFGIPLATIGLGYGAHNKVLTFKQTVPELMRSNGFKEIVIFPKNGKDIL